MNSRRYIAAVWLLFIVRGMFYAVVLPLWEGFDEWSHFAYVQRIAENGDLLVDRRTTIPRDIDATFSIVPLPWVLRGIRPASLAHDHWWRLPGNEQAKRQQQLWNLPDEWAFTSEPAGEPIYEALQPPLYYWISAGALFAGPSQLVDRVFTLRLLNVLIASLVVPIAFVTVRQATGDPILAVGAVVLLAAMPELCIDIARVSNEALSIVVFAAVTLLGVTWPAISYKQACVLGIVLGLGLLTKAYFLVAAAAVILLIIAGVVTSAHRRRRAILCGFVTLAIAIALSGWWYVRNKITTGTWTGLSEAVELRDMGVNALVSAAAHVDWRNAVDSILVSHVWFGGWSALTLRSWMYHVLFAVGAFAAAGVVLRIARSQATAISKGILFLAMLYCLFWVGEAYNVVLISAVKHVSTSMGWYLYAVAVPEVAVATWGLAGLVPRGHVRGVLVTVIALFAALDLYGMHFVLLPYYTGSVSHRPNGTLEAFHLSQIPGTYLSGLFARVSVNRPAWAVPASVIALWVAYVAATVALLVLSFKAAGCIQPRNADSLER
jgi:hypothetical protein